MTARTALIVIAAIVLEVVIGSAFGRYLAIRDAGDDLTAVTTSGTTTTTAWAETVPTLPSGFDPLKLTTTTTRPKVKARRDGAVVHAVGVAAPAERRGIPCGGGEIPPCSVLDDESMMTADPLHVWNDQVNADGGQLGCYYPAGYTGDNPCGTTASGPWQILRSTWAGHGGFLNAADAPLEVQLDKVRQLWQGGRGCQHWNACR